jgi:membrane protease YdiL (CAAX protease family)
MSWLTYTLLTLLASAPFYLLLRLRDADEETRPASVARAFRQLMWVPGVVALGLRFYSGAGFGDLDFGPGRNPWLLLVALLFPPIMEILLIFTVRRLNLGFLDGSVFGVKDGWVYLSRGVRLVLGTNRQTPFKFALNLTATVAIGAALNLIFSFAEELGWRGTLQPLLIERFTLTWGMFLGGLLWGAWHAPAVLNGYKFPAHPRLGAFVFMPIFCIAAGIVAGWLYWLSGSLWTPAIFNASLRVSGLISEAALEEGGSARVRIVWLWLWAAAGGLALTLWYAAL